MESTIFVYVTTLHPVLDVAQRYKLRDSGGTAIRRATPKSCSPAPMSVNKRGGSSRWWRRAPDPRGAWGLCTTPFIGTTPRNQQYSGFDVCRELFLFFELVVSLTETAQARALSWHGVGTLTLRHELPHIVNTHACTLPPEILSSGRCHMGH